MNGHLLQTLVLPFLALHAVFFALWLYKLALYGPEASDWLQLKIVADHFVAGDWSNLYTTGDGAINPGYFWRYPPYALYLVAPLAWVTRSGTYALLVVTGCVSLLASLLMIRRLTAPVRMEPEWWLAASFSAPALSTLVMGQSSALMLLGIAGAAFLSQKEHPLRAYAVLALFALKPNWGIFFGLFALLRRDYRGVLVMAGIVLTLCLFAAPLGAQVWRDFFRSSFSNGEILAQYSYYKQITLKGFLDATLGRSVLTTALWAVAGVGLCATAAAAWRVPAPPVRHLGLAVLLAVAANPYASFYDALVLVFPAAVWWSERAEWRRTPWLTVGWLIAAVWCWEQYSTTWAVLLKNQFSFESPYPPFSIVGPAVSIWLVVATREVIRLGTKSTMHVKDAVRLST